MMPAGHVRHLAARALFAAGLLTLGYAAYVVIDTAAYQAIELHRFEDTRRDPPAAAPALRDGMPLGLIRIPRLGLEAVVVHGDSAAVLRRAVGHLPGTAVPGATGNVVLAGHRDTFFRPLEGVREGDTVALTTRDGDFAYLVESTTVVPPDAVEVLRQTDERTLTLITCYPFAYVGAAPHRLIVRAREIGRSR